MAIQDAYAYLKRKGFVVGLFTNGSLLTKYAELLRDMPPEMVHLSLYGTNEDEYREITGISGQFEMVTNSLEMLQTTPIPFELRVIVTSLNYTSVLAGNYDQLGSRYGVNIRYSAHLYGLRSGSPYPTHLRLSPQQLAHLYERSILGSGRKGKETKTNPSLIRGGCPAGDSSINVYSDGQFSLCAMDVAGRTGHGDGVAARLKARKKELLDKFSQTPCAVCSVNNGCICCQVEYLNSNRTYLCEVQHHLAGVLT